MIRVLAIGLAVLLAIGLLPQGSTTAEAASTKARKGGTAAMETLTIAHEGMKAKKQGKPVKSK